MEKFFIFICSLSVCQLKILNESQPISSNIRNDLPIIFNNQFKDCLTNSQRMSLADLESMSLTRYIILKDSNGDICPENLDFRFMKYRIKDTDSDNENDNINNIKYKSFIKKKSKAFNIGENNYSQETNNTSYKIKNLKYSGMKIGQEYGEDEISKIYDYESVLNSIKNKGNRKFIDSYKKKIIKVLNSLNKEEREMFLKSKFLLKGLIEKLKDGIKDEDN